MDTPDYAIDIAVHSQFVADQSRPNKDRYVFAYTITLRNTGAMPAQLLARHWVINDSNGKIEEVSGDGVIGEQPWMHPGEDYQYSSSTVLATSVGTMQGSYSMQAEDGTRFDAAIPPFVLSIPRTLH